MIAPVPMLTRVTCLSGGPTSATASWPRDPGTLSDLLCHLAGGFARDVVDSEVSLAVDGLAQAKPCSPGVSNPNARHLVPEVMAAEDDQLVLFDKALFLTNARQVEHPGVIVPMVVVGGFVGNEDIASQLDGPLQGPGVAHPANGNASHVGIGVAGLECVDGSFPVHPTAVERIQI